MSPSCLQTGGKLEVLGRAIMPVRNSSRSAHEQRGLPLLAWFPVYLVTACSEPADVSSKAPLVLWQVASGQAHTAPLVTDSQVVVGGTDGWVTAFERRTGARLWTRQLASGTVSLPGIWGTVIKSAAGLVIVPQWELWGVDPRNGEPRWRFKGPDGAAGTHDPATAGDTVFAVSAFGWVSAVDARTGEAIWAVDLGEAPFRPAISPNLVIYGTRGFFDRGKRQGPLGQGHVVALRKGDGSEAWRFPLPDSAGFPLSGGALSGGVVWRDRVIVPGRSSRVYALRLSDGALLWEAASGASPTHAGYYQPGTILGDVVVLFRDDRVAEGWNPRTGAREWSVPLMGSPTSPASLGAWVYVSAAALYILDRFGRVVWRYGGLELTSGTSFTEATVSADGTVYALGNEHPLKGFRAYLYAIRPPTRP